MSDVAACRGVTRKRSFARLIRRALLVTSLPIRLPINAPYPERSFQLSGRLLNIAGYDHPELTKAYVRSGCRLNDFFGNLAALAIRIKNHTVKAGFSLNAGQRTVVAIVNYLDGLLGQPRTYLRQAISASACV